MIFELMLTRKSLGSLEDLIILKSNEEVNNKSTDSEILLLIILN